MFCTKCGANAAPEAAFCNVCGTKLNEWNAMQAPIAPIMPKKQRKHTGLIGFISGFLVIALIASTLFLIVFSGDTQSYEEGYSSPEAAAMAYLEGLRDADVEKMLSSYCTESLCDGYYFTGYQHRNRTYARHLLENCEKLGQIDLYALRTKQILQTYLTLTQEPQDTFDVDFERYGMEAFAGVRMRLRSDFTRAPEELEEYADILRNERWLDELSEMKIGRVRNLEDFLAVSRSEYAELCESVCEWAGYDSIQTVIIEVTIEEHDLYFVTDTAYIDGAWFNCGSIVADMCDFENEDDSTRDYFVFRE
ncbi:MAG: hypothetical protein E7434_06460 [Ruminococcaceae bacterium]|nr:hypothetical protein [Oscillospiraceae bacterium]